MATTPGSDKLYLTTEELKYFKYYIDNKQLNSIDCFMMHAYYKRHQLYFSDKLEIRDFRDFEELEFFQHGHFPTICVNMQHDILEICIYDIDTLHSISITETILVYIKQFHYIQHNLKNSLYIYILGLKI